MDIKNLSNRELSENILKALILVNWKIEQLSKYLSKTDLDILGINSDSDTYMLLEGFNEQLSQIQEKVEEMYPE